MTINAIRFAIIITAIITALTLLDYLLVSIGSELEHSHTTRMSCASEHYSQPGRTCTATYQDGTLVGVSWQDKTR